MKVLEGGIFPALPSPCNDRDELNEDSFTSLVSALYAQGIHGVYVCGATGEGQSMPITERKRLAEIAVELSREHQGSVMVHVGAAISRDAIELARHASQVGAHAVSSMLPQNCSHMQLMDYYAEVADVSGLPVVIYHYPLLSKISLTFSELLAILEIEGIVGLKWSDWNLYLMRRLLIARPETLVFNGFDQLLFPALLYGARGGIGTWYNVFPRLFVEILTSVQKQDCDRAMELQDRLISFLHFLGENTTKPIFELILNQRGYGPRCFRQPREALDDQAKNRIQAQLNRRLRQVDEICEKCVEG